MIFWDEVRRLLMDSAGEMLIEVITEDNPARLDRIWQEHLSDLVDSVVNHWSPHRGGGVMEVRIGHRRVLVDWKHGDRNEVLGHRRLGPDEVETIMEANDRSIYHGVIIESTVIRLMSDRM